MVLRYTTNAPTRTGYYFVSDGEQITKGRPIIVYLKRTGNVLQLLDNDDDIIVETEDCDIWSKMINNSEDKMYFAGPLVEPIL